MAGGRIILALLLSLALALMVCRAETDDGAVRIVTEEELKTKTGAGGEGDIWLSVLGEVYDVTSGRSFYAEDSSYGFFAGKDASPCFATGKFNDEGLKTEFDEINVKQLESIEGWRKFYEGKDNYPLVGLLEGKFYDSNGKPTATLDQIRQRLETMARMKDL